MRLASSHLHAQKGTQVQVSARRAQVARVVRERPGAPTRGRATIALICARRPESRTPCNGPPPISVTSVHAFLLRHDQRGVRSMRELS